MILVLRPSDMWRQAVQLGDKTGKKYRETCSDCLVAPVSCLCSGVGDFVAASTFLSSSQEAPCAERFLPVPP